jgi:hypothetical protein
MQPTEGDHDSVHLSPRAGAYPLPYYAEPPCGGIGAAWIRRSIRHNILWWLWTASAYLVCMGRSREGNGRHRQPWIEVVCVHCGQTVKARRTLPGKPLHVRTHLNDNWDACPPLANDTTPPPPPATMSA